MKILIILGFALACWLIVLTPIFAILGSPYWAIGSACLAVLLWFISYRENDAYNERMEDRMFYSHPRL